MEINDKRFEEDVQHLLQHPSTKVRAAAMRNLYFLNSSTMITNVSELLNTHDDALTIATLEYLFLHAGKNSGLIYDRYLDDSNKRIADAALICLAREARDNQTLKLAYNLKQRIQERVEECGSGSKNVKVAETKNVLLVIGMANMPEYYSFIFDNFSNDATEVVETAIEAAGMSMYEDFIPVLLNFLENKKYRRNSVAALQNYGSKMISVLTNTILNRLTTLEICRFFPMVIKGFNSQEAVRCLLELLNDPDLGIRLESIRALSEIRRNHPELKFNRYKVVAIILEECKLHHKTLSAMHTQIIISYRNRKKSQKEITEAERDARTSLLELLERRLDAGLERIFKLLGLRYRQKDVEIAYEGLLSEKQEAQANAIEFLDNLLTGDLKRTLLPIIEETALDVSSEEVLHKIKHTVPTEMECFKLLLEGNDLKLKLAVLYLIKHQKSEKYIPIVENYVKSDDLKLRTFAAEALNAMRRSD